MPVSMFVGMSFKHTKASILMRSMYLNSINVALSLKMSIKSYKEQVSHHRCLKQAF